MEECFRTGFGPVPITRIASVLKNAGGGALVGGGVEVTAPGSPQKGRILDGSGLVSVGYVTIRAITH